MPAVALIVLIGAVKRTWKEGERGLTGSEGHSCLRVVTSGSRNDSSWRDRGAAAAHIGLNGFQGLSLRSTGCRDILPVGGQRRVWQERCTATYHADRQSKSSADSQRVSSVIHESPLLVHNEQGSLMSSLSPFIRIAAALAHMFARKEDA